LDLVTASSGSNTVSVLLGNGNGTFQPAVSYSTGATPASVAVGDFNGDGRRDLVTANYRGKTVSRMLGKGTGPFQPAVSYGISPGHAPNCVAVGDFTCASRPDLVTANSVNSSVSVLLGNSNGTFQIPFSYGTGSTGPTPASVAVGD